MTEQTYKILINLLSKELQFVTNMDTLLEVKYNPKEKKLELALTKAYEELMKDYKEAMKRQEI